MKNKKKAENNMYEVKVHGGGIIHVYAFNSDDAMRAVKGLTTRVPVSARKI